MSAPFAAGVTLTLPFGTAVQTSALVSRLADGAAEMIGLAVLAAALAGAVALGHRWYTRERVPGGLPVLVGLSGVAVAVGATGALRQVIGEPTGPIDETAALVNVATMLASAVAARTGTNVGDRVGTDLFVATGAKAVESEVSRVVQAVGRVITVEVPDEIEDLVGYDPVPDETKESLAGRSFVFPRRLTVEELRDRLVTRLKADYAVGHVDVELAADGTVEYLALGSRASGIGPTLPPETSAVAVRADPAFAASAGDLVQVWRTDPLERVLTAELRGKVEDVVTLAVDAADTRELADDVEYKLVTLPVETRPDREFASLLRAAEETMAAVTVAAGSALAGQPLGALDVSVVAVRPAEGPVEPLPGRERLLAAGDSVYLVAKPEAIRKVEAGARAPDAPPTAEDDPGAGPTMPPDQRVDATTPVAGGPGNPGDASEDRAAGAAPDSDDRSQENRDVDTLADEGVPGIRALEGDSGDSGGSEADKREASDAANRGGHAGTDDSRASGSGDGERDGASDGDGEGGDASGWTVVESDDPDREDLADLPGTDPEDLTGTDLDESALDPVGGNGEDGPDSGDGGDGKPDEAASGEEDAGVAGGEDAESDGEDAKPGEAGGDDTDDDGAAGDSDDGDGSRN